MSIAWTTVEDAIHNWVVAGSGLAADHVIWSQQNSPRPDGTFISLRVISVRRIGQDWLDVLDNPGGDPGEEIEHRSRGVRECTLSIQCFADDATGLTAAVMRIDSVISALNLPSARDALNDAGVGVARFSPVQSIDGALGSALFDPRAIVEAVFFLASEVSELGTFIEFVELENEDTSQSTYVPSDPTP